VLVNGKWTTDWHPVQAKDEKGGFVRQVSGFRNWITPEGDAGPAGQGGFAAEAGRYHLYVALICPWASRTLIARKLKHLDDAISVSVVEPALSEQGWRFGSYPGADRDEVNGAAYLHEIYTKADPGYSGRATVPVLWDKARSTIVNNESADIVRMLNAGFGRLAGGTIDLYPHGLRADIDALNERIYPRLNNGVYRAGFATTQVAYEEAFAEVFGMLDELEKRLDGGPFLFGERFTEADIRLFVTLIRFDAAYHGLFKCNLRRIADYPNLSAYLRRVLAVPGIRDTVDMDHIKCGYYSIKALNPTGIVPVGPDLSALCLSGRGRSSPGNANLDAAGFGIANLDEAQSALGCGSAAFECEG
jgi:glutathionyl-hydroquinone reductase